MNKISIIIIIVFFVLLLSLVVVMFLIKNKKKKRILSNIDRLTTEKNMALPASLVVELNKVEKLTSNDNIKKKVDNWKNEYNLLSSKEIDNITDLIVSLDDLFLSKKYKECSEKIPDVEAQIYHLKAKGNKLLDEIKDLTESEGRNREAIVKVKSLYRNVVFKYNKNKDEYNGLSERIELQFENIDKLFSGFEVSINNNDFEELSKIVKALDDLIHNIDAVIEEAPTIMLMANILIPKKMKDIKNISEKLRLDGYNLEYLNIDYNIEETNKKISEILDKLKVLNIENSIFDLKTFSDYFESLYNDFDNEKNSKIEYEKSLRVIAERLGRLTDVIRNLYNEIDVLKDTYDLKQDELDVVDEINKEVVKVRDDFKLVNDRSLIRVMPYSKLNSECLGVIVSLSKAEDRLEHTLKNLGSLKEDEIRARDELGNIRIIINDSKHKIKENNLPVIPKVFYVELKEAEDSIKEIEKELEKKPISINNLNLRVETSLDLALKVYKTVSNINKLASLSEKMIVYGNRYISTYKDIEESVNKSSELFFKGEYEKSLENILNSLNVIEPGIYKKILKGEEI